MIDYLKKALAHAPDVTGNGKKLKSILLDLAPSEKANINLFTITVTSGIVEEISAFENKKVPKYQKERWVKKLTNEWAIDRQKALWAIECWCEVFGAECPKSLFEEKEEQTEVKEPKSKTKSVGHDLSEIVLTDTEEKDTTFKKYIVALVVLVVLYVGYNKYEETKSIQKRESNNIEKEKGGRVKEKQEEKLTSISAIREFIKEYYGQLNNGAYREAYDEKLSESFKSSNVYSKYYDWFANKVAYVRVEEILNVEKISEKSARVKVKLYYLQKNGKFICSEDTLKLIYDKKWLIDDGYNKQCSDNIKEYSENGINLKIEYPLFAIKDNKLYVKITMTSDRVRKQGGLTVGFPQYQNVNITDEGSTFTSVSGYGSNSKVWNKELHRNVFSRYFIYEGWHSDKKRRNAWYKGTTKVLAFSFYVRDLETIKLRVRAVLNNEKKDELVIPTEGVVGQQGYKNLEFDIPVLR